MVSPSASNDGIELLRFVPEPILVFDRSLTVVLANDLACELLHTGEAQILGVTFGEFLGRANEGARERLLHFAYTAKVARLPDVVLARFDGQDVRADVSMRALKDASAFLMTISNARGSVGLGSMRRAVETSRVLVTHGPLHAVEDVSTVACLKSEAGVYVDIATSVSDFAPGKEAMLGKTDREIWDPELAAFIETTDRLTLEMPGRVLRQEQREGLRTSRVYKTALADETGRRFLLLLHLDVRQEEEERQRLVDADQRHRAFLAASSDLLLLTNEDGVVLDFHSGGDVPLRRDPTTVLGSSFDSLLPSQAAAELAAALAALRTTGQSQEVRLVLEVDDKYYDARVVPCGGRRVVLVIRNVTERERARALEARLARAEKLEAIAVLAGGIGHDFNNILSVVASFTELLRQSDDMTRIRGFASDILLAARRGHELATELVGFTRGGELHKRSTELAPLLDEAARALGVTHPGVVIAVAPAGSIRKVLGDPSQLYRVIVNLAKNAADAVRERPGGKVTLSLEDRRVYAGDARVQRPGRYVVLRVHDNGIGMDAATLARIFDPFFTKKAEGLGTGLGLSVVHGIVRAHEGEVLVTSQLGEGATFDVLLPTSEADPEEPRSAPAAGTRGRLLLVEDDHNVGRSLALLLQSSGYDVELERSPLAALSRFADETFDLVITDLNMPELDGLELARRLHRHVPHVPVVLLSGRSTGVPRSELAGSGIRMVLAKPIALREIEEALQRLLSETKS